MPLALAALSLVVSVATLSAAPEPGTAGEVSIEEVGTFAIPKTPSQSSPIAVTPNGKVLITVNPDQNSVSFFDVSVPRTGERLLKTKEVPVGADPRSIAIHPNGSKAYVACSAGNVVSVLNVNARRVISTIQVGVEPHAVALSPNGTRLYVANSASNTVQVFDTPRQRLQSTIDLSSIGTAPRSIAVTNDKDNKDNDETVYVPMFYGQLRSGRGFLDEGQDDQREGRVAAISTVDDSLVGSAVLGPVPVTGFNSNGKLAPGNGLVPAVASTNPQAFNTPTGAYPNQLAGISIHPTLGLAYVVGTGASPNGPVRFNSNIQGLVSVFNTGTRAELVVDQTDTAFQIAAPLNLNRGVNLATTPAPRLFHSNPVAMAWRPNGTDAWVVIQNTNLLVRLTTNTQGVPGIGAPTVAGPSAIIRVDLSTVNTGQLPGLAPQGVAINQAGTRAYVFNFVSRSVSTVDISNGTTPQIIRTAQSSALPAPGSTDEAALVGAALWFTGRGPQERMSSEGWGGCVTCHPEGRSDNVTWMFDGGPRQTIALDGTFAKGTSAVDQRILNWSSVRDENHDFELNTRNVFGGRGIMDDDRLFLAMGGAAGSSPTYSSLVEQFHQATGQVSGTNDLAAGAALPALPSGRRDFALATLEDGRSFLIGGRTGSGNGTLVTDATTVLEFNPRTNSFTPRSSTGFTPRFNFGAAAVKTSAGPRIYAIGGYFDTNTNTGPTPAVEEYNPATNTWRTVASMPFAVSQHGTTVAGGVNTAEPLQLVHVVFGNVGTAAAPAVTNRILRFQPDPSGPGIWSSFIPSGLTPRRNHGVAAAQRGVSFRIFIIGGQDSGGNVLSTVEEYTAQAVTAVTSTHTSLPAPRTQFGVTAIPTTNQIYVVGGLDNTGADQTSIFEYTVANNGPVAGPPGTPSSTWTTRGNLAAARSNLELTRVTGVTNFLPARNGGRSAFQDALALFVSRIRTARAPVPASDPAATRGRALFGQVGLVVANSSCVTCHGGPKWSRSRVDYPAPPSPELNLGFGNERVIGAELRQTQAQGANVLVNVGTFVANTAGGRVNEIRANGADAGQAIAPLGANGFNIPSLLSVYETAPYFYSGLAQTLTEVLDGSRDGNGGTRHHFVTDAAQRADLVAFLRSIDQSTPIFP